MNINIKTSAITLTPAISDYVGKRFEAIEKLLNEDPSVKFDVELARTTSHHNKGDIFKAEVHIIAKGENIYASIEKEDLYVAIDLVRDEVVRKINSTKKKRTSLLRRGGAQIKNLMKGIWPDKN